MRRRSTGTAVVAALLSLTCAARARADERGEALLLGAAVNRLVGKQLPATFALRGERASGIAPLKVTLFEARYCGALDATHGRLVGVVRPGEEPARTVLTGARDCQDTLEEVAHRLPGGTDAAAVVELVAEWIPWQLRFSIGNVSAIGEGAGPLNAALARTKAAGPLGVVDTAGLRLETARGASLTLDLAVGFVKADDAVLMTLTPGELAGDGKERRASFVDATGASATDAVVGALFPLANRIVALFSQDGPLVLELERQVVEVRSLQLSGGDGALTIRGRATPRALRETVRLAIEASGGDLKITEVRAEPELEDCGALSTLAALGCRARNTARVAAVAAVASGLTARYKGQLLRVLLAPPPFSFELGGRRLTLRLTPSRARATPIGLIVTGRAELD
ncbi:MAG: hypothetical protein JWM82_4147 [Myxococcales bacterium]|nr:hypothetical protein [Myxococcales bacterium]